MKNLIQSLAFLVITLGIVFTSCGPSKKLLNSEAKVDNLKKDSVSTHGQLVNCTKQLTDCNALVKKGNYEKESLQSQNASVQSDLKDLTTASEMTIADQNKRLKAFQAVVKSQKDVMTKLKNSIAEALMNYKTDELYVYIQDGKVYVSLEEKLLFKSGSDVVDAKGKEALMTLAKVINTTKDITVMIEGHTDNVPIKTTRFTDNWDLSTARATSIVRILTNEYGFDSDRITASGRGAFHPLKANDTEAGRASNRRTEIILSPDLKELYKLLDL